MAWLSALAFTAALSSAPPAALTHGGHPQPPTVADPMLGLDLWRGARVGMEEEAVRRRFPTAATTAQPATLTGGQRDLLYQDHVDLAGHQARAHFYFSHDMLITVELTLRDLRPGQTQANLQAVSSIADQYAKDYGAGYDCGARSLGDVSAYECKWLHGRVAIQLWYMDVAGQAPLFYIAFKQADDPSYSL